MTIRVLVVDDSVVIRKLLSATLNEVPGIEVVATAPLGRIALAKIPQCNPDVVILDVEMPEMDGIETLKQIRKLAPRLPVIMFSTKTERGAASTIEALTSGASDYVAKPSNAGNVLVAMARVREEMVPKIQALAAGMRARSTSPIAARTSGGIPAVAVAIPVSRPITAPPPAASSAIAPSLAQTSRFARIGTPRPTSTTGAPIALGRAHPSRPIGPRAVEIVAIGASTGGPNALAVLLTQLPAELPVPIVIVQHMLATFTRHFADRLATQCRIQIVEANHGDVLAPGCVYIARGDYHLEIERRTGRATAALHQGPVENFCRPAVDVLFRSVAQAYGPGALAVVLTGMGHDGLLGCGAIRDAGGDVIVQDEASSVVWGMPGFVARAGLASQVLPIDLIGGELRRRIGLGARASEARP